TDSMNYIPVSLENQANPHAGASEVTNSAGTSQTLIFNASEEKDEDVELIVVPSTKVSSTNTLEDNPKILAFRRELEEIALKHLGKVSENTITSTPSVNIGSEPVNTGSFDPDNSPMPELKIFHKSETRIFDIRKDNKVKSEQNQSKPTRNGKGKTRVKNEAKSIKSWISPIQQEKKANESPRTNVDKFLKFKGSFGYF
ncbi:hypothetical protein Tco_0141902, partial [Tanacetum coccineum]